MNASCRESLFQLCYSALHYGSDEDKKAALDLLFGERESLNDDSELEMLFDDLTDVVAKQKERRS